MALAEKTGRVGWLAGWSLVAGLVGLLAWWGDGPGGMGGRVGWRARSGGEQRGGGGGPGGRRGVDFGVKNVLG